VASSLLEPSVTFGIASGRCEEENGPFREDNLDILDFNETGDASGDDLVLRAAMAGGGGGGGGGSGI
jgi:hypothetical protein